MEELRASRWAKASEQVVVAPYYRLSGGDSSSLILVNRFGQPLDIAITVHGFGGLRYPLGTFELRPRESMEIDLRQALRGAPSELLEGSLRTTYHGDPEMLQAWIVLSGPKGLLDLPLVKASASNVSRWVGFWDGRLFDPSEHLEPRLYLHNTHETEVVVEAAVEPRSGPGATYRVRLGGGQTAVVEPKSRGRWAASSLRIHHDGQPGQVAALGILEGRRALFSLPLTPQTATSYGDPRAAVYHSLTIPETSTGATVLALFNFASNGDPDRVRIALLAATGDVLAEIQRELQAGEIWSTDLGELIHEHSGRGPRIEVSTERRELLSAVVGFDDRGQAIDVPLIPRTKVHATGTYPLPDLRGHVAATTLLNVGDEPAEILGHLEWNGGAYSLKPFTILPGGTHRLDFNALASAGEADLLGRSFSGHHDKAFFQWLAKDASAALLARTEIRRKDGRDVVGFNCFGCCEEFPYGAVLPGGVVFDIGQTPSFEAVIYMSTCSGTVGPYSASPDFLSYGPPLSWDGSTISASGYTSQTVEFSERITYEWVDCSLRERTVRGAGPAAVDTCQEQHNPDHDHTKGCTGMYGGDCEGCKACADREHEVAKCRCNKLLVGKATCLAGVKAACQNVKQQCIASSPETCANTSSSCS
jgi:hypothetical protein